MTELPPPPARAPAPPPPALRVPRATRRPWAGAVLSLLAHLGVIALVLWPARALLDGAGGLGPGPRGGGGGGGRSVGAVIALEAYAAPVPEAAPEPEVPVVAVEQIPMPEIVPLDDLVRIEVSRDPFASVGANVGAGSGAGSGAGTGTGGGRGSGTGTGVGTGEGSGSGGDGRYILRAQPRGIILPPQCVPRGSKFLVRFWVGADGRVTDVDIQPTPRETSCRRDFEVRMRGYRFEPAKARDGLAVASVFPITIER